MSGPDAIEAAVIEAVPNPLHKIGPREISDLFGRSPSFMERTGTRKRLYAQGFPAPVSRGVWLARDVVRFILRRSAGLPTQPVAIEAAAADADMAAVMTRTRQHLNERRERRHG